jgi:inner membrane protein
LDNLAHSLAGMALAETALQLRGASASQRTGVRSAMYFAAIAASNITDFDFLYLGITGGKLGYLLHHRGHTHTLLGLIPLFSLIMLMLWGWQSWTKAQWSQKDWRSLALVSAVSLLMHLWFDFHNSYGIHPFWPYDSRWFYGDTLFIIEPMVWLSFAIPLYFLMHSRLAGGFLLFVIAISLGAVWFSGVVPWLMIGVTTIAAAALSICAKRLNTFLRPFLAWSSFLLVTLIYFSTGTQVRNHLRSVIQGVEPDARIFDITLTPMPVNPFCWMFITAETDSSGRYVARRAMYAVAPEVVKLDDCRNPRTEANTAPLVEVTGFEKFMIRWDGVYKAPLNEMRELYESDCVANAALRFMRNPYWVLREESRVIGDLRYDMNEGLDFADLDMNQYLSCPKWIPDWVPPRQDILRSSSGKGSI